jgi:predicted transcriptional regulator
MAKPLNPTRYKKFIQKFEEGSSQELIDMLKDLSEIWMFNYMTGDTIRASMVR